MKLERFIVASVYGSWAHWLVGLKYNRVSNQLVPIALKEYQLLSTSICYKPAPTVLSLPSVGVDMVTCCALGNWTCD